MGGVLFYFIFHHLEKRHQEASHSREDCVGFSVTLAENKMFPREMEGILRKARKCWRPERSLPINEKETMPQRQPRPENPWVERLFVPWSDTHGEIPIAPQLLFPFCRSNACCVVSGFHNTMLGAMQLETPDCNMGCIFS